MMAAKKHITLAMEGLAEPPRKIAWYQGTPHQDILNTIRATFGIDYWTQFGIYDDEHCGVVLSDHVPDGAFFWIKIQQGAGSSMQP